MNDPNQVHMMNPGNHHQMQMQPEPTYTNMETAQPQQEPTPETVQQQIDMLIQPNPPNPANPEKKKKKKKKAAANTENSEDDPEKKEEKPKRGKREAIEGQAREIIFKVIKFFESEKAQKEYEFPVQHVLKRASAATGISVSTLKRIKKDGLKCEATNTKMTGPKKKRQRKPKQQLDYYELCCVRSIVNGFISRKEVPTLSKILAAVKNDLSYRGGKESLRQILLTKLGIKIKKTEMKEYREMKEKKEKKPVVNNTTTANNTTPTANIINNPTINTIAPTNIQKEQKPSIPPMQFQHPMMHSNMMPMHHPQPMQPSMLHPQMHPMKMEVMENACAYSNMYNQ